MVDILIRLSLGLGNVYRSEGFFSVFNIYESFSVKLTCMHAYIHEKSGIYMNEVRMSLLDACSFIIADLLGLVLA